MRGGLLASAAALTALMALMAMLAGCGPGGAERHPEWVLRSQVKFYSADLQAAREPLPRDAFRLFFPFIAGDLYGPATTGDFLHPVLQPDYTFEIDLNQSQPDLLRSLQPTEFSLDYLRIDPPEARIARLAPVALQPDGIEQVAVTDWIDAGTRERLMLVYVDRPSRITGSLTRNGYTVRYNIHATQSGYIWVARRQADNDGQVYTEVAKPEAIVLALTPPDAPPNVPRRAVLPARTGTPAP
ncbi:MAG TPA: hypothetical protein VHB68_15190 [Steroidobacteraceae bacterium]|nr:hypothetical protein [Steroidobacteraceae bacterium]